MAKSQAHPMAQPVWSTRTITMNWESPTALATTTVSTTTITTAHTTMTTVLLSLPTLQRKADQSQLLVFENK